MKKYLFILIAGVLTIGSFLPGLAAGQDLPGAYSTQGGWRFNNRKIYVTKGDIQYQFNQLFIKTLLRRNLGSGTEIQVAGQNKINGTLLARGVNFFQLDKGGDNVRNVILAVKQTPSSENYGTIIRAGYNTGTNTTPNSFIAADGEPGGRDPVTLRLAFSEINNSTFSSINIPDKYRPLFNRLVVSSQPGVQSPALNIPVSIERNTENRLPEEMVNNCSDKLPDKIDLNNPPEDLKKLFDEWNEVYGENEKTKIPRKENEDDNQTLYQNIIPQNAAYPSEVFKSRMQIVSTSLDELNSAIEDMWKKSDIEAVNKSHLKTCLVGTIVGGALGAASGGPAGGAAGGAAAGIGCGLSSAGINKLVDSMRGTNTPRYYAKAAIAVYYNQKLKDYLDCIKKQDGYEDLPENLREQIETESTRTSDAMNQLQQEMQRGIEESGSSNLLQKIIDMLIKWLNDFYKRFFGEILKNLLDNVPI